jgi:hypothetical protein
MHGIVGQYEKNLMESREMLAKLEKIILSILDRDEVDFLFLFNFIFYFLYANRF